MPSGITKLTPNVDSFLPWNGAVYILCKILQTSYLRQQKSRFRKFSLTIKNTSLFISVDKVKDTFKPSTTTKTLSIQTLRHYRMVPCIFSIRSSTTSCLRRQRPILWQISLTIIVPCHSPCIDRNGASTIAYSRRGGQSMCRRYTN